MKDSVFEKYVDLIMSMSIDYKTKGKLSKETYVANLEMIVKVINDIINNEEAKHDP